MLFGLNTLTAFLNLISEAARSRPVPTTLALTTSSRVATRTSHDHDRQDSTQLRAQRDFATAGPPPMPLA